MCRAYGGPDVVSIQTVETPSPRENELLVRVVASTVNRTDCGIRSASPRAAIRLMYGLRHPRRPILGSAFAGQVEVVGPAVRGIEPGDHVFGFDDRRLGGHSEYLTMPVSAAVSTIPDGVAEAEAAASTEGAHYALTYIERADVRPGQQVLVYGASGAVGTAAVQLLVARGAVVTAVAATKDLDLMRRLGAARVIDYTSEDYTTTGTDFDLVFDAVGKTSFRTCERLLRDGGYYMATEFGPRLANLRLSVTTRFRGRCRVAFPLPLNARRHVAAVRAALADATFRPVIDRTYALDDIVEAYRYVETGQKTGNVVLTVSGR